MNSFVTDTQALVKFMMGKKVINDRSHKAYQSADKGKSTIIIPAIVLMEMLYLFEKNRINVGLLQTEELFKSQNYQFEPFLLYSFFHLIIIKKFLKPKRLIFT